MADVHRLPAPTHDVSDWQSRGACSGTNTAVFFHPEFERGINRDTRIAQAKAICARCPVLVQCREHALIVQEPYGTWGGLGELQRTVLIRDRRRRARQGA